MLRSEIVFLSDRMPINANTIPAEILTELQNRAIVTSDTSTISFCGVISSRNYLAIFFPRNSQVPSEEKKGLRSAHHLFMSLIKYYRDKDNGTYSDDKESGFVCGKSFSNAAAILVDYQKHGIYVRRSKSLGTNSGKINWSATLARQTMFLSKRGPCYLNLSTSRQKYVAESETSKIHAAILSELFDSYGVLWTGNTEYSDSLLADFPRPTGNTTSQLSNLRKELQLSYSERDIFLIKSLINYLSDEKGTGSGGILLGVRFFHSLWEAMLDTCLAGKYAVNSKLPIPVYRTDKDVFVPVAEKGQRTDTVICDQNKTQFAIIDAKYYDASTAQTGPGWPDLVKQFYYEKMLSHLGLGTIRISNHFVFPGLTGALKAAYIAKRGVKIETESDCLSEYPPIYCHYQDPLKLLEVYSSGEKLLCLTEQILNTNINI